MSDTEENDINDDQNLLEEIQQLLEKERALHALKIQEKESEIIYTIFFFKRRY